MTGLCHFPTPRNCATAATFPTQAGLRPGISATVFVGDALSDADKAKCRNLLAHVVPPADAQIWQVRGQKQPCSRRVPALPCTAGAACLAAAAAAAC